MNESSQLICIVAVLILVFACTVLNVKSDEEIINGHIEEIDGKVIDIEQRFVRIGPFNYVNKGGRVYKIDYIANGEQRIGWVRFNFFGKWQTKWEL